MQIQWSQTDSIPAHCLAAIGSHVAENLPMEAVGLLWEPAGRAAIVVPLLNVSEDPESSYEVDVLDIQAEFRRETGQRIEEVVTEDDHLTLWHSHPSGVVGPSRRDMQLKEEGLRYMVISVKKLSAGLIDLTATVF